MLTLIVWHFMPTLIHTCEGEVAVLSYFSVLDTAVGQRLVASFCELLAICVLQCQAYGLAAEPVADVVCVAVVEADPHTRCQNMLKIREEIRIDKVAGMLELKVDVVVGVSVVRAHADGFLYISLIEILDEEVGSRGVSVWMTDVVDTPTAVVVVRRLDVVTTHIRSFLTS